MVYRPLSPGVLPGGIFSRLVPAIAAGGILGAYIWNKWNQRGSKNMNKQPSQIENMEISFPFGKTEGQGMENISLKSVSIRGHVEGLLVKTIISQEYRNDTDQTLEIIYTFPIAWDTALLGMKAKIVHKELVGQVVEKTEAEEQYEEALEKGNSAIMVQKSAKGLYTANLGNIKPGETVIVEIHCAKLTNLDNGRIRLCIPTVISLRYGDQHAPGALARHETAMPAENADYPLTLSITVGGDISPLAINCPTHPVEISKDEASVTVQLGAGAKLDRDFVLLIDTGKGESIAQYTEDGDNYMEMAAFCPKLPEDALSPIGLKILVDCSGSMSGERINQAKDGLVQVIKELTSTDHVSFSRFGTKIKHSTQRLVPFTPEVMQRLSKNIEGTTADMGGTNMEEALASTFNDIAQPGTTELPPAVLLITDGDVWNTDNIIAAAKKSGHRVFAIGVGSAPAESLLMEMAEQSGGACEFVTPNESMTDAILRIFRRMRTAIATDVKIEWHGKPLWESQPPKFIYNGETAACFALMPGKPQTPPVLRWKLNGIEYSAKAENIDVCNDFDLAKLGVQSRVNHCQDKSEKLSLALKYQLVSDVTSLILVYEREAENKITETAKVQQVPQMWASGHGCGNSIRMGSFMGHSLFPGASICHFAMAGKSIFSGRKMFDTTEHDDIFLSLEEDSQPRSCGKDEKLRLLANILDTWHVNLFAPTDITSRMAAIGNDDSLKPVLELIVRIAEKTGLSQNSIWASLIKWTYQILAAVKNQVTGSKFEIDRHSKRMIKDTLKSVTPDELENLNKLFNNWLEQDKYPE